MLLKLNIKNTLYDVYIKNEKWWLDRILEHLTWLTNNTGIVTSHVGQIYRSEGHLSLIHSVYCISLFIFLKIDPSITAVSVCLVFDFYGILFWWYCQRKDNKGSPCNDRYLQKPKICFYNIAFVYFTKFNR